MNPEQHEAHDVQAGLRRAAHVADATLRRSSGDGSRLSQIANAEVVLPDARAASLAAELDVLVDRVKHARVDTDESLVAAALERLPAAESGATRLPLNRKERYYTGTVLPMVAAADGFAHLPRLLALCGLQVDTAGWIQRNMSEIQFFTEYGFAESVFTEDDATVWPEDFDADTPDIVIRGDDWLLAIEAKMFHDPDAKALNAQLARQNVLVELWRMKLGIAPERVSHVALLPERLRRRVGELDRPVVTWEQLIDAYVDLAPSYWLRLLQTAIGRHEELESRSLAFGKNADGRRTGSEIVTAFADGDHEFAWVGRGGGGRHGNAFASDIADGGWRTRKYEVSRQSEKPDNKNWFSVADFVEATAAAQ